LPLSFSERFVQDLAMASATFSPVRIDLVGDELAIAWSDGKESYLKLEALRKHCPCAACGGEPDVMGNVVRPLVSYGPKSFSLASWRIVGGYSLQPTWADGHDTGLYVYSYLRRIADEPSPL
jgi:DUF971 family protein